MELPTVRFNKHDRPEFFKEVRKRVNRYFEGNNISRKANFKMKFKTVFMIALYFVPFALIISGLVSSQWNIMLMWILMGFGMSGIGSYYARC